MLSPNPLLFILTILTFSSIYGQTGLTSYSADLPAPDSLEVELLSSNFLSENRYSGEDRKEHGLRLGYGMQLQFNNDNGSLNKLLLGRTYHNEKQDQFNYINGFEDNHSDIVGNYSLLTGNKSSLYYDFRISEDFSLNRNRLKTNFDFDKSKVNVNYIQVKNFASRNNPDTEQISYGFEI